VGEAPKSASKSIALFCSQVHSSVALFRWKLAAGVASVLLGRFSDQRSVFAYVAVRQWISDLTLSG
jgi:hypothetical protein